LKKQIKLNKKTIQKLKLHLQPKNDRKAAPAIASTDSEYDYLEPDPSNGQCEGSRPWYLC
jgi:hypothetical protein